MQFRYYLLAIILLLIELMPVIAKTILPSGTYDEKALLREALEIEMARENINKEKTLQELYFNLSTKMDADTITDFFTTTKEARREKINRFSENWKEQKTGEASFANLWKSVKRDVLTRQEP